MVSSVVSQFEFFENLITFLRKRKIQKEPKKSPEINHNLISVLLPDKTFVLLFLYRYIAKNGEMIA